MLPGEVKLRWKKCSGFFWDVSSQALQFAFSLSLQAVQLLIGGGSIINKQKYIGLDGVPCKTAWFMDVYRLDVALRSESQKCLFLTAGAPLGLADKDSNMLMQS